VREMNLNNSKCPVFHSTRRGVADSYRPSFLWYFELRDATTACLNADAFAHGRLSSEHNASRSEHAHAHITYSQDAHVHQDPTFSRVSDTAHRLA
jgi:hypothetical protein